MRVKHPVRSIIDLIVHKAPVEAQLIITRRCNLSCGYCSEYDDVSPMIPLDVLKERIDALHRLKTVNIALLGGEPLMHAQLAEIVAYADRESQVSVTTNGFLITQELIGRLNQAGLRNMEVSIDSFRPDPTGYIQKCLKTVRSKLELLREHAAFDVNLNLVLCEQTRPDFKETVRQLCRYGFPVSLDLLHSATGAIEIGGEEYLSLWKHYYAEATPFSFLEEEYGERLLSGERPAWKCRAGMRFLYVDEGGKAQFCSAQRGRLGKPITEFTRAEALAHGKTFKGCEEGCSLLCHYRDSSIDNRPVQTVASMVKLFVRHAPLRKARTPLRGASTVAEPSSSA
jgi:molybdenum cofactor biosynthesis enzyme MoaA